MTHYLKTNWDLNAAELVEVFDELPLWAAPFGLKLLNGIKYKKGIRAVDIGFGAGFPLTEIAMRLGAESKVFGIDPWEAAVDRAQKKIRFYGIQNIQIIRGVAENIPLENDSVDLIVSNNGLNNVSNLDQSLSECNRIMKSGGQFIQTLNLEDTMMEFYSTMENALIEGRLEDCLEALKKHISNKRKPLDQYLKQLESHGFTVESVIRDQFEYRFVDGTTMLNHHFIRLAFIDGWKSIVPSNRQVEVFERIEHELNRKSSIEGMLVLSVPFATIDCKKL